MPDSPLDGPPAWFMVAFGTVGVLVALGFVLTIVVAFKNGRALKRAGINPLTANAELVAKLARSELLAPAESLEARLAELDALRAKGLISEDEHRAARAKALGV